MKSLSRWLVALLASFLLTTALAQPTQSKPGLQPYVPNRIEWLALVLNSQLRQDATVDSPFSLSVVNTDHETILIFVCYQPNVDREILNMAVETAREVTQITAKSYGWVKWVKVKERIEMVKPRDGRQKN
ncbi:MAG: hypothetical protein Q7T38_08220 [Gallionella sp.]|nr:hypothetical protein [Gallionella sp.]